MVIEPMPEEILTAVNGLKKAAADRGTTARTTADDFSVAKRFGIGVFTGRTCMNFPGILTTEMAARIMSEK